MNQVSLLCDFQKVQLQEYLAFSKIWTSKEFGIQYNIFTCFSFYLVYIHCTKRWIPL